VHPRSPSPHSSPSPLLPFRRWQLRSNTAPLFLPRLLIGNDLVAVLGVVEISEALHLAWGPTQRSVIQREIVTSSSLPSHLVYVHALVFLFPPLFSAFCLSVFLFLVHVLTWRPRASLEDLLQVSTLSDTNYRALDASVLLQPGAGLFSSQPSFDHAASLPCDAVQRHRLDSMQTASTILPGFESNDKPPSHRGRSRKVRKQYFLLFTALAARRSKLSHSFTFNKESRELGRNFPLLKFISGSHQRHFRCIVTGNMIIDTVGAYITVN